MKSVNKFKPIKQSKERSVITIAIPIDLLEKLDSVSENEKISKNELVRQMIQHCLMNMEEK